MKASEDLHVVVVTEMTNKLLVPAGWAVGETVCKEENGYGGPTFGLGHTTFFSREAAEAAIKVRGKHFSGVKFGVASYRRVKRWRDPRPAPPEKPV